MTISNIAWKLFELHRSGDAPLSKQAGSFCGQLVVEGGPLTDRQRSWLEKLVARAGLPPIEGEHA